MKYIKAPNEEFAYKNIMNSLKKYGLVKWFRHNFVSWLRDLQLSLPRSSAFFVKNSLPPKIFLDTSVWVSYFGESSELAARRPRSNLAGKIVGYCKKNKIELFYNPYVEHELMNGTDSERSSNIENKMKKVATKLPAHSGNSTWEELNEFTWQEWGTKFGDQEEVKLGNRLEEQLPDGKNRSNKIDRNIVVTAKQNGINIILHENPRDYRRMSSEGMIFIDLTSISSLSEFVEELKKANK